ncbi:MAG: hypothetical protein NTX25_01105, partial [Proteobacteria bacterium]|nr:hypothetical protein [Pseudomonadota bacterium]
MKTSFNPDSCLKSLAADFAAFRSQCRPNLRFPKPLREAVLEAIDLGLKPSAVSKVLGVTSTQLKSWRQHSPAKVVTKDGPRILNVTAQSASAAIP